MNNDITELRMHLFDTLRGLKAGEVDIELAKAVNETAQTIINSAKVEVDHMRLTGSEKSSFIETEKTGALADKREISTGTLTTVGAVTRHRMAG